jgi:CubicO group peptidase (beta-lactamase class C family)
VIVGLVAPGYEPVRQAFEAELERDSGFGAAFAAVVDSVPVVHLWGGLADSETGRPWRQDTACLMFSGTKGLTATCILKLIDQGKLSLDRPVSEYWPEYGRAGKRQILVRHLVSHQAGLPAVEPPPTAAEALDPMLMASRLAGQTALWRPGEAITYHALTFGWLCDGLIRHVDGRSVARFFAEEVARPLGLDAWIGLPAVIRQWSSGQQITRSTLATSARKRQTY